MDRRLFVSGVDFLLNYVARKLSFNYEILQKKLQQRKANENTLLTEVIPIFPLIWFPTKESIVARVVAAV